MKTKEEWAKEILIRLGVAKELAFGQGTKLMVDCGDSLKDATPELGLISHVLEYYAEERMRQQISKEPKGVVPSDLEKANELALAIWGPWNYDHEYSEKSVRERDKSQHKARLYDTAELRKAMKQCDHCEKDEPMTDPLKSPEEKCQSNIILNGEEVKCLWNEHHWGCHSGYTSEHIKLKWSTYEVILAERKKLEEKDREIERLMTELKKAEGTIRTHADSINALMRMENEISRLKARNNKR